MAIKPKVEVEEKQEKQKAVKTAEGIDLTLGTRVKFVQRDLATRWPSSAPDAENVNVFQDYLSLLLDEDWEIEKFRFFDRRSVGPEAAEEYVYPIALLLIKVDAPE